MRVLGGTGLSAHSHIAKGGASAGSTGDSHAHTLNDFIVVGAVDGGIVLLVQAVGQAYAHNFLNHMRRDKVSTIGNCGAKVGNLERGGKDFALADSNRYDCIRRPSTFAVGTVVVGAVGNEATAFAGEIDSELVAITHRHKMLLPHFKCIGSGAILGVAVEHVLETPAEISVA